MRSFVWILLTAVVVLSFPLPAVAVEGVDPLSPSVRAWLADEGPIRVGWAYGIEPVAVWEGDVAVGGFGVDLWEVGAAELSVDVEHVPFETIDEVVEALRSGDIDIAGGHADRPDLLEFAEMASPSGWTRLMLTARRELAAEGDPADGATVTTVAGSPLEQVLSDSYPELTLISTPTIEAGVDAVAAGDIDYYFNGLALLGWYSRERGYDLVPVGDPAVTLPLGSWAVPGTPAAAVNDAVRAAVSDGELRLLHTTWTGFDLGDPAADDTLPVWLLPAIATLMVLLAVTAFVAWLLRLKVRTATAELALANEQLEDVVTARTGELAEANVRLERSNTALQRFGEVVAHDLRGPLLAIVGMATLVDRLDDEKRREFTSQIATSTRGLIDMVDRLLNEAGRAQEETNPIADEDDLAAWLRAYIAPEASLADAAVTIVVPDGRIDTDVPVLRRAAANLVGNALKHTDEDDPVVDVVVERSGETWTLTVSDNGPGIPEDQREAVFERGRQLTPGREGFGLGLHAIRELVVSAGGTIAIGGSPLGGVRATVELPTTAASRAAQARV